MTCVNNYCIAKSLFFFFCVKIFNKFPAYRTFFFGNTCSTQYVLIHGRHVMFNRENSLDDVHRTNLETYIYIYMDNYYYYYYYVLNTSRPGFGRNIANVYCKRHDSSVRRCRIQNNIIGARIRIFAHLFSSVVFTVIDYIVFLRLRKHTTKRFITL